MAFILFCPYNTVRMNTHYPSPLYASWIRGLPNRSVRQRLALRRLHDNIEPPDLYCICVADCLSRPEHCWNQILSHSLHSIYPLASFPSVLLVRTSAPVLLHGCELVVLFDINGLPGIADPHIADGTSRLVPILVDHVLGQSTLLLFILVM